MTSTLTIKKELDSHDDIYYTIVQDNSYIIAEKINDLDTVLAIIEHKLSK